MEQRQSGKAVDVRGFDLSMRPSLFDVVPAQQLMRTASPQQAHEAGVATGWQNGRGAHMRRDGCCTRQWTRNIYVDNGDGRVKGNWSGEVHLVESLAPGDVEEALATLWPPTRGRARELPGPEYFTGEDSYGNAVLVRRKSEKRRGKNAFGKRL